MNRVSNRDASSRNNQNRQRNRGRNNNNRRGPNPLQRSYESNGPDVKIRGNAMQVAEKYTTLARDAQVSGDRILAENYMQHAEHYNRIIAAAQLANQQQQQQTAQQAQENQPQPQLQESAPDSESVNGAGPQPGLPSSDSDQPTAPVADGDESVESSLASAESNGAAETAVAEKPAPRRGRRPRTDAVDGEAEDPSAEKPARKPRSRRTKPVADADVAVPVDAAE